MSVTFVNRYVILVITPYARAFSLGMAMDAEVFWGVKSHRLILDVVGALKRKGSLTVW